MLEPDPEEIDAGVLIEGSEALVDHDWSEDGTGQLGKGTAQLLDRGFEGVVASVENADGAVMGDGPLFGQRRCRWKTAGGAWIVRR